MKKSFEVIENVKKLNLEETRPSHDQKRFRSDSL